MHRHVCTTNKSHGSLKSCSKIIPRTSQPHLIGMTEEETCRCYWILVWNRLQGSGSSM